ncbi:MAG TPA: M48 family metalloprotease [Kofleriaceae bacterium]|nr:M48 family metalloprotease [Kofleriaceae bacterium]
MWVAPLAAQPAAAVTDEALEHAFRADLEKVSAAAAEAFDAGNAARAAGQSEQAVAAYRRASELAPGVDHPHRRACGVLDRLGRIGEAMSECETAIKLAPASPYSRSALATVLESRRQPGDLDRALALAREAAQQLPSDPSVVGALCRVLLARQASSELERCSARLLALDPGGGWANLLGTLVAGANGDLPEAKRRLELARAAGLDDATYRKLGDAIASQSRSRGTSAEDLVPSTAFLWSVLWVFVGWLSGMVVLLAAGYLLSWLTLREVARVSGSGAADGSGTPREQRLRRLYKLVLVASGGYFYLSIPFLLALILGAGGGVMYVFLAAGVFPIKLMALVAILVFATVGSVLRGLFVRRSQPSLGHRIDLDRHPRLAALIDDVSATVGTRPAGAVYLTPGTDMAVTERAGVWATLRGKAGERSLIMGVGLFDGMTQLQLRSVLAHEHGHFRNEDTAGGELALAVRRSLMVMIISLARSGAAQAYNPVWWFLRGYHRIYLGVSQGASRLQEVLADRWAIRTYGTSGFVAGYRHVVTRSVEFDHRVNATIQEVVDAGRPLPNLYQYQPQDARISEGDLAAEIERELNREPSAYDSHPSAHQRIEWALALAVERSAQPDDDASIWTLFEDREAIERAMTDTVRKGLLAEHGISITAAEDVA